MSGAAPHTSLFAATTSGTFWASPAGGTVPTTTPVVTTGVATGVDDGAAVAAAEGVCLAWKMQGNLDQHTAYCSNGRRTH